MQEPHTQLEMERRGKMCTRDVILARERRQARLQPGGKEKEKTLN